MKEIGPVSFGKYRGTNAYPTEDDLSLTIVVERRGEVVLAIHWIDRRGEHHSVALTGTEALFVSLAERLVLLAEASRLGKKSASHLTLFGPGESDARPTSEVH